MVCMEAGRSNSPLKLTQTLKAASPIVVNEAGNIIFSARLVQLQKA